jgi:uncharacterized protein (DUF433 family)
MKLSVRLFTSTEHQLKRKREEEANSGSGYWVAGTRVSLDSLVYASCEGHTAESLAQSFPVLTLEQVYGALTYDLAHREVIDVYLRQLEADFPTLQQDLQQLAPMFYPKLADARRQRQTTPA